MVLMKEFIVCHKLRSDEELWIARLRNMDDGALFLSFLVVLWVALSLNVGMVK